MIPSHHGQHRPDPTIMKMCPLLDYHGPGNTG